MFSSEVAGNSTKIFALENEIKEILQNCKNEIEQVREQAKNEIEMCYYFIILLSYIYSYEKNYFICI